MRIPESANRLERRSSDFGIYGLHHALVAGCREVPSSARDALGSSRRIQIEPAAPRAQITAPSTTLLTRHLSDFGERRDASVWRVCSHVLIRVQYSDS